MTDFSSCVRLRCFQLEKQGKTHRSLVSWPLERLSSLRYLSDYISTLKKKRQGKKNERTIVQGRKSLICIKSSTYELCYPMANSRSILRKNLLASRPRPSAPLSSRPRGCWVAAAVPRPARTVWWGWW